ncbi:N-acetyltransferase, partial [Enterococcus faecalis]|nr:N-acetyltransferase [Enterococcus faecalis]
MFFLKKRKIKQLQGLCTQYEYELSRFKYWKKLK